MKFTCHGHRFISFWFVAAPQFFSFLASLSVLLCVFEGTTLFLKDAYALRQTMQEFVTFRSEPPPNCWTTSTVTDFTSTALFLGFDALNEPIGNGNTFAVTTIESHVLGSVRRPSTDKKLRY
jgi:hypothetical protein